MTRVIVLLVVLSACDGVGRAIVGPRPLDSGRGDAGIEEIPCDPLRVALPENFEIDEARLVPPSDCDGDGFDDAADVCPGVPNPLQEISACADASQQCARLIAGALDMTGADLRGCAADLVVSADLSLANAELGCARISFESTNAAGVDLTGAHAEDAVLEGRGAGAVTMTLTDALLAGAIVRVEGGASAHADSGSFASGAFVIGAGTFSESVVPPALRLHDVALADFVVVERGGGRAGRIRFEDVEARGVLIRAAVMNLVGGTVLDGYLDVDELTTVETAFSHGAMRATDAVISGGSITDFIVDRCTNLLVDGAQMTHVDIPVCAGGPVVLHGGHTIDSRIRGADATSTRLIDTVVGPAEAFTMRYGALEHVRLCQLGALELRSSRLEVVYCTPEDVGTACVDTFTSWAVDCAPVLEAPSCRGW